MILTVILLALKVKLTDHILLDDILLLENKEPDYFWPFENISENSNVIAGNGGYSVMRIPLSKILFKNYTDSEVRLLFNRIRYQYSYNSILIDFLDDTGMLYEKDTDSIKYVEIDGDKFNTLATVSKDKGSYEIFYDDGIETVVEDIDFTQDYDAYISGITSFYDYLKAINHDDYAIFVSVMDEGTKNISGVWQDLLYDLGAVTNINGQPWYSYYAVLNAGRSIDENIGKLYLESSGTIGDTLEYKIVSAYITVGNESHIYINGVDYSKHARGMNFVVYNLKTNEVVDAVNFDTYEDFDCLR